MTSLEMINTCEQRGLLSKEAAASLRERRVKMIKSAMRKQAISIFSGLGRKAAKGERSFGDLLRNPSTKGGSEWRDVAANILKLMGLAGATAGVTHGIHAAGQGITARKLDNQIAQSYNQIFEEYPRLKDEDPERVRKPFGLLARVAPNLAAEPMVAGAFVYNNIQQGGVINPGDIKALAEAQNELKKVRDPGKPPYFAQAQTAANFAGKAMLGGAPPSAGLSNT